MKTPINANKLLENWLDDAIGSSLLSVSVNGYKGSEENIDERRKADYDKALLRVKAEMCRALLEMKHNIHPGFGDWVSVEDIESFFGIEHKEGNTPLNHDNCPPESERLKGGSNG